MTVIVIVIVIVVRIGIGVGEGKRRDTSSSGHFNFTHLPMHCFCRSPWNSHFFSNFCPHVSLESVTNILAGGFVIWVVQVGDVSNVLHRGTNLVSLTFRTTSQAYFYGPHPTHSSSQDSFDNVIDN